MRLSIKTYLCICVLMIVSTVSLLIYWLDPVRITGENTRNYIFMEVNPAKTTEYRRSHRYRNFKDLEEYMTTNSSILKKNELQEWITKQIIRRETLVSACQNMVDTGQKGYDEEEMSSRYSHVHIDGSNGVFFCALHKAATTTWMDILGKVASKSNNHNYDLGFITDKIPMMSYNEAKRREILTSSTTFMMVRHPLKRVASAYNDKFAANAKSVHQQNFKFKYGRDIARLYYNITDPNDGFLNSGVDVTFEDFVRYLTDSSVPELFKENVHWDHYLMECPVCEEFTPDFILKYEHFNEDLKHILALLYGVDATNYVNVRKNKSGKRGTSVNYDKMLNDLPSELYEKLRNRYKNDMDVFGYI